MAYGKARAFPAQGARRLSRSPLLPRSFYARPASLVAPDLLGQVLVRGLPGGARLAARIVETEAYEQDDPASHAFRGATLRNASMFGPPGHLYVYFTYGMHFCMNAVTGPAGVGSAVLLRAGEPLEGIEEMTELRAGATSPGLCSGPARWTRAFAVDRSFDGQDLVEGRDIWVERGERPMRIAAGPRVGVGEGADRNWRFFVEGERAVSKYRRGSVGRPAARPSRPSR